MKLVRSTGFDMRILLFAAYGSNLNYNELVTPIDFPLELRMGIDSLNFNSDEIHEYVRKWFKGYALLESYVDLFCEFLTSQTGNHVGLCATAIAELNEVFDSRVRSNRKQPSAQEWTRMLVSGTLDDKVGRLFDVLVAARAVGVINTLEKPQLDFLAIQWLWCRQRRGP